MESKSKSSKESAKIGEANLTLVFMVKKRLADPKGKSCSGFLNRWCRTW
jgi:hypothetical protein